MTTLKGRTYRVALSDGSVVWLNAASSLYYPEAFGGERRVEVTGEAYFEVTKDASRKLIVVTKNVSTEVLGTSFNVNTYEDESDARLALLEGSIQLKTVSKSVVLKPGQQGSVSLPPASSKNIKVRSDANLEQGMAWKNGLFKCRRAAECRYDLNGSRFTRRYLGDNLLIKSTNPLSVGKPTLPCYLMLTQSGR